jgi:hypothetical protein
VSGGVQPITADQAAEALEGCADRSDGEPMIHCYIDLPDALVGADWTLGDAVALDGAECVFTVGPQMRDLAVRLGGVMYRLHAWKPTEPCACACSCWSQGQDALCDACRMNIHAGDRARPRPVLAR